MTRLPGLHPPEVRASDELTWILQAAFSSTPPGAIAGLDRQLVRDRLFDLGLGERIATRPAALMLPDEDQETLRNRAVRAAATGLMYEGTARHLAELASELSAPIVFLKGFALSLNGCSAAGSRPFGDLDILTRPGAAQTLQARAVEVGFEPDPAPATEQHLAMLSHPQRGAVEIHFQLRGLRTESRAPMTFDALRSDNALEKLDDFPGDCFLPDRDALAAHALAHGLQQHLLRPRTYYLLRMMSDLVDLLPDDGHWDRFLEQWGEPLSRTIPGTLISATRSLASDLATGEVDTASDRPASILLRHFIAGSVDSRYADSLALSYLSTRLREAWQDGELVSYCRRKLFGPPGSRSALESVRAGLGRQLRSLNNKLRG